MAAHAVLNLDFIMVEMTIKSVVIVVISGWKPSEETWDAENQPSLASLVKNHFQVVV
jgi:hypothetical protein